MRVITLNMANYDDVADWDQRVQMIAADIVALDADLIALQEVRFNPDQSSTQATFQNMAEQVLYAIEQRDDGEVYAGTRIVTQPAMYYPTVDGEQNPWEYPLPEDLGTQQEWEGLSILSRLKVLETGSVFLTKSSECTDANRRITQYVSVPLADDRLYLFNTHFGLAGACLRDNVQETLAFMAGFGGYQLLVGDMNATPDDPALEPLRSAGLTDLWPALEGASLGYTFQSDQPTKRIDYCWGNGSVTPIAASIELVATEANEDGVYASDHFGLCVSLETESG